MDNKETQIIDRKNLRSQMLEDFSCYLARNHAAIVVLSGPRKGAEYAVRQERVVIGRGKTAQLRFDDSTMSKEHAVIEFVRGSFHLRDLESANGTRVGGEDIDTVKLQNGTRFELGKHQFEFVLFEREPKPKTHVIDLE